MWPKISHLTTYVFCERKLSLIVVEFYYFIPIRIRGQQYCTPSLRQRHWLGMLLWRTLSDSDKFWCKCCWENVLLNDHLFAGCSPLLTEFSALPGETWTQEIASFQLNAIIVAWSNNYSVLKRRNVFGEATCFTKHIYYLNHPSLLVRYLGNSANGQTRCGCQYCSSATQ